MFYCSSTTIICRCSRLSNKQRVSLTSPFLRPLASHFSHSDTLFHNYHPICRTSGFTMPPLTRYIPNLTLSQLPFRRCKIAPRLKLLHETPRESPPASYMPLTRHLMNSNACLPICKAFSVQPGQFQTRLFRVTSRLQRKRTPRRRPAPALALLISMLEIYHAIPHRAHLLITRVYAFCTITLICS